MLIGMSAGVVKLLTYFSLYGFTFETYILYVGR